MVLKSGLSVWCYTAPGQSYYPPAQVDYSRLVESLTYTTVAPGGFGQLTCKLNVASSRIPRSELAMFSHIAVLAPGAFDHKTTVPTAVFLGEITQPELSGDQNGEFFNVQALGMGNCLRDDPHNVTYTGKTALQIITSEMTTHNRNLWMPISTDLSQVFPDNPAASLSPSYMGYGIEDILNDVCLLSGDYQWGVWCHPTALDAALFPLAQLFVHLRDSTTVHYQATMGQKDLSSWRITPSADRAYNGMIIYFTDPSNANNYGSASATDSRLAGNLTQGTAPFRFRNYLQDFTGTTTVTGTEASAIEATQLGIMKNPTNKISMVLKRARNAQGLEMPLWSMTADSNINMPELARRAQVLNPASQPGTDLFYILSTKYSEDSSGAASVALECDNWYDYSQTRLARLELAAYRKAMNGTTTSQIQALGSPDVGNCGYQAYNANAGASFGTYVNYHTPLAQTPTSITLSGGVTTNANTIAASSIGQPGFFFSWTAPASGNTEATRQYQTVGNCLLDVDRARGTFTHHCDGCDTVRKGLKIKKDVRLDYPHGTDHAAPGEYALSIDCSCGTTECLNTALFPEDEVEHPHNSDYRANLAYLIRQIQQHLSLPRRGDS